MAWRITNKGQLDSGNLRFRATSQIVSIVTVLAADQPAAVGVALAVVSDALKHPLLIGV